MSKAPRWLLPPAILLILIGPLRAPTSLADPGGTNTPAFTAVPFAFYNSQLGAAAGLTVGRPGLLGEDTDAYVTLIESASGTAFTFVELRNLRLPGLSRLSADLGGNVERVRQLDVYASGNPRFPNQRAGDNDSSRDNHLASEGSGHELWTSLQYVLPLGEGLANPQSRFELHDGLVLDGARLQRSWNPLRYGYTTLSARPFWRTQQLNTEEIGNDDFNTAGIDFALRYENTDFSVNPSHGSAQEFVYSRDWGWLDSSAPWETVSFMAAKYLSLGGSDIARQSVIALNFWIVDTLSWNDFELREGARLFHRPPPYLGATLGGQDRMRGFDEGRFNARSAVYYTAEYRFIPDWNPLKKLELLKRIGVKADWFQFVGSIEVGRVADRFNLEELHSDMQECVGLGIRAMLNEIVVRAGVSTSREGTLIQMTVDQPF